MKASPKARNTGASGLESPEICIPDGLLVNIGA